MFNRIIVPVDGSDESQRAISVGDRFAVACDAELEIVWVVPEGSDVGFEQRGLRQRVAHEHLTTFAPMVHVVESADTVAETLRDRLVAVNGSLLVMASSGRGRTGAILGSVATDVLRTTFGPVVFVGPETVAGEGPTGKDIVVAVDGSPLSEASLGLAGAWSIGFNGRLWVTTMTDPDVGVPSDTFETNYVARLAEDVSARTERDVEFEVLHGTHAARAVTDFADRIGAGLIIATTHGRTGVARLAFGSTSAEIVRHASCPVVLIRPPALALANPRRAGEPQRESSPTTAR